MLDRNSETWIVLRGVIRKEIARLQSDLEIVGVQPDPIRGEIKALRWVIKTVEPDAPLTDAAGTDYLQAQTPDPT